MCNLPIPLRASYTKQGRDPPHIHTHTQDSDKHLAVHQPVTNDTYPIDQSQVEYTRSTRDV